MLVMARSSSNLDSMPDRVKDLMAEDPDEELKIAYDRESNLVYWRVKPDGESASVVYSSESNVLVLTRESILVFEGADFRNIFFFAGKLQSVLKTKIYNLEDVVRPKTLLSLPVTRTVACETCGDFVCKDDLVNLYKTLRPKYKALAVSNDPKAPFSKIGRVISVIKNIQERTTRELEESRRLLSLMYLDERADDLTSALRN